MLSRNFPARSSMVLGTSSSDADNMASYGCLFVVAPALAVDRRGWRSAEEPDVASWHCVGGRLREEGGVRAILLLIVVAVLRSDEEDRPIIRQLHSHQPAEWADSAVVPTAAAAPPPLRLLSSSSRCRRPLQGHHHPAACWRRRRHPPRFRHCTITRRRQRRLETNEVVVVAA